MAVTQLNPATLLFATGDLRGHRRARTNSGACAALRAIEAFASAPICLPWPLVVSALAAPGVRYGLVSRPWSGLRSP